MSLREIVSALFYLLDIIILLRLLMGWLPMAGIHVDPYTNPVVRVIYQIADPILEPFRRLLPPMGGIDFSPIIAILVLNLVSQLVISVLPG